MYVYIYIYIHTMQRMTLTALDPSYKDMIFEGELKHFCKNFLAGGLSGWNG